MSIKTMSLQELRNWMDEHGYEYDEHENANDLRPVVSALISQEERDEQHEREFEEWCLKK